MAEEGLERLQDQNICCEISSRICKQDKNNIFISGHINVEGGLFAGSLP